VCRILIAIFPLSQKIINCIQTTIPTDKFNYTSRHEIEEVIKSLKSSNSYRYDKISVKIIKEGPPFISSPLTKICNQSSTSGIFPECLKRSDIQPVYMNGDKHIITK
jgi:hypothetical protein